MVTTSSNGLPFISIETTGIRDTQIWIESKLLHSSYELFTNSICYPQENENSFVKANAATRKALLLEIVGAKNFDTLYEKAKVALNLNESNSAVTLSKIEGFEATIKRDTEKSSTIGHWNGELERLAILLSDTHAIEKEFEEKSTTVRELVNAREEKKRLASSLTSPIHERLNLIAKKNEQIERVKTIDIAQAKKDVEMSDTVTKEMERVQRILEKNSSIQRAINKHLVERPNVPDYTKDIQILNQRLIPLIKDTGSCPSGDLCPFVRPIQGQIDFLSEQITSKESMQADAKKKLEEWEKAYVAMPKPDDSTDLYPQLSSLQIQIKKLSSSKDIVLNYEMSLKNNVLLEEEIKQMKDQNEKDSVEIAKIYNEIENIESIFKSLNPNEVQLRLIDIRNTLKKLNTERDVALAGKAQADQAIKNVLEAQNGIKALEQEGFILRTDKTALTAIKEALSPRGIKATVVDFLVPQLEEKINAVLGQMSDFRIHLDTQKALADEEGMKEGLFITVINDRNEEMSFSNYSGGEKIKITIAISEALASLMPNIGFRIMDENIVSLDKESTENFVEVLAMMQHKFDQLLVVSHLQEVKDVFEKKITCIKTNGVTKLI
jgi:exonuclease SbcC